MAYKMGPTISFSVVLLAILLTSATAGNLCKKSDDKVLCNQLTLGSNDWSTAMSNAIALVQGKVNSGKSMVDNIGARLPVNLKPQTKQSIDATCQEIYGNMVDNLQQAIGFVKKDIGSLKTYLSATSFSTCTDALEEFGVDMPEVEQFSSDMLRLTGALLALADKH